MTWPPLIRAPAIHMLMVPGLWSRPTPISQSGVGRDHNPGTMSMWMAGARIKGGQVIGASDEFGYKAEQQPIAIHDLHATMLHLLGMDHTRLTYLYNGRNMRLTDVYGDLIPQIVSS